MEQLPSDELNDDDLYDSAPEPTPTSPPTPMPTCDGAAAVADATPTPTPDVAPLGATLCYKGRSETVSLQSDAELRQLFEAASRLSNPDP